jgi:hypothetical protein
MKYGQSDVERDAKESIVCREIVQKILDFGVNERQKLQIIGLIALELENREDMIQITEIVKSIREDEKPSQKLLTS